MYVQPLYTVHALCIQFYESTSRFKEKSTIAFHPFFFKLQFYNFVQNCVICCYILHNSAHSILLRLQVLCYKIVSRVINIVLLRFFKKTKLTMFLVLFDCDIEKSYQQKFINVHYADLLMVL